jgi:hypothetical protein
MPLRCRPLVGAVCQIEQSAIDECLNLRISYFERHDAKLVAAAGEKP